MLNLSLKPAHCSEAIVRFIRQDLIDDQGLNELSVMDIAFVGASDLDERSAHSVERSSKLGERQFVVRYDPKTFTLTVGNKSFRANGGDLEDLSLHYKANSIVIDATTLDFAEIALLLYAYTFSFKKPKISFLYVEPKEYVRRALEDPAVNGTAFDLSDGFSTQSIPPFSPLLNNQNHVHLVAFLGFEGGALIARAHCGRRTFCEKGQRYIWHPTFSGYMGLGVLHGQQPVAFESGGHSEVLRCK